MRTHFWTRNLWIGVLMAVVLVLGILGDAEAITSFTRGTGDLQTVITDNDFQITFRPNLVSPVDVNDFFTPPRPRHKKASTTDIDYAAGRRTHPGDPDHPRTRNYSVTIDAAGTFTEGTTTHFWTQISTENVSKTDSDGNDVDGDIVKTTHTRNWVSEAAAYHYNGEQVTIAVTAGGATLEKVGRYDAPSNGILMETGKDGSKLLNSSMTLTFAAPTSAAEQTITITDSTTGDYPAGISAPTALTFTVYVVPDLDTATTVGLAANTNEAWVQGNDNAPKQIDTLFTPASSDVPVIYKVQGPGRLYIRESSDRKSRPLQTLSTSKRAEVYLDMNGGSNRVTIEGRDTGNSESILIIFQRAQIEIISGNDQTGVPNSRLRDPLRIRVKDGKGRPLSGLAVTFNPANGATLEPVIGSDVYLNARTHGTAPNAWSSTFADIDRTKAATATVPNPDNFTEDAAALVPTNRNGEAQVYLKLGADNSKTVTVTAGNAVEKIFDVTSSASTDIPSLEIVSGNNQRSESDGRVTNPLIVRVLASNNQPLPMKMVTFTTTRGYLTTLTSYQNNPANVGDFDATVHTRNGPATQVTALTDVNGRAAVSYDLVEHSGASEVVVQIKSATDSLAPYQRRVTFNINGGTAPARTPAPTPAPATNTITITLSSSTGEPGDEIDVEVDSSPRGVLVNIDSGEFDDDDFTRLSGGTPFTATLRLPDEDGEYTFSATRSGFTSDSATVTVETGTLGRITLTAIGTPSNGAQNFTINVRDTDGTRITSALTVRLSGSGFTTRNVATLNGIGDARLTLPTTAGLYTLTASADNYVSGTTQVRVGTTTPTTTPTTTTPPTTTEPEPEPEAPEPASIEVSGPATRSGTVNEALEAPLLARVLDDADNGVADVSVIFRVRTGRGRLSQRGNGRAVGVRTDSRGYARADFTPLSAGTITIEAEVRGITQKVSFTITTGLAPAAGTSDTGETPTPSTTVSPVVNAAVDAASRPPMLWVSGGKIYALVGSDVEVFIANVENATNLTVGGGKVYWTAKTSETHGTLNSANLDGTQAKQLRTVWGVPRGITLNPSGSNLYWVDAANRLQSSNLDGSGIQNVLRGLSDPRHVAVSGGKAYWIGNGEGTDTLSYISLTDPTKTIHPIVATSGTYGGLTIAGNKLYWTEKTSDTHGKLHTATLDGTGRTELPDTPIWGAPVGIAVDTARSHLYWTDAVGRLQRANLDGSGIHNVIRGLGRPGDMVISNSITAPTPTPTTTTTTSTGPNKYDVNGDGAVNADDENALLVALLAESTEAKYDIDGDGTVSLFDLVDLRGQIQDAAGAPTLLGMKLTAVQIDRLQAQINLLVASGDRSPAALKTLIYLQQLIALARPEKTQLLANYPNPFNPETWIPYELAADTDVRITIYNAQGVVIRTLSLGQQSAGYYTDRERAAYWDGRNALGEQVASGIYFYQLETDQMSSMRKMVILK